MPSASNSLRDCDFAMSPVEIMVITEAMPIMIADETEQRAQPGPVETAHRLPQGRRQSRTQQCHRDPPLYDAVSSSSSTPSRISV